MKSRLLDLHRSAKEDLPRILLYSVMVHYIIFYYFFGNPFLVLIDRKGSGGPSNLDVELLSPNDVDEGDDPFGGKREFPVFPPEKGEDEEGAIEFRGREKPDDLSEDGMNLVENVAAVPPPKKIRKAPPNMTGPEDCMLKLVGMVCPNGDFDCIEAYKEFCTHLPE
jgi:hypothetical protein